MQTVFIDTDSPYLGKGWPIWRLPPLPIVFRARLGRRFEPREDHHVLVAEVQAHLMQGLRGGPMAQGPQPDERMSNGLPSSTHLVLIPSYNPGPKVYETVAAARRAWSPVWVVVDGSSDGTAEGLRALAGNRPRLAGSRAAAATAARARPCCTASISPRRPASRTR